MFSNDEDNLKNKINATLNSTSSELENLQKTQVNIEKEIEKLELSLSKLLDYSILASFPAHIIKTKSEDYTKKINELYKELGEIRDEIYSHGNKESDLKSLKKALMKLSSLDMLDFNDQKDLVSKYIHDIIWKDGELTVNFNGLENNGCLSMPHGPPFLQ